jgi:hypothetical protein
MTADSEQIIIKKRTPLQDKYSKLYAMFLTFFFSTIFLLIPLFYQAITSLPFLSHSIIIGFFFIGIYGYIFIFAILLTIVIRQYGGAVSKFYTDNSRQFENAFIIILILSLVIIFVTIPGLGLGSFAGGASVAIITYILNRRNQKKTDTTP